MTKEEIEQSIRDSAYDFERVIIPTLQQQGFITGEFQSTEAETNSNTAMMMDIHACIDALARTRNCGVVGIASRLQYYDNWTPDNFTIRTERTSGQMTELGKLRQAIASDSICPNFTVQAYLTKRRTGELVSFAVIPTKLLVKAVDAKMGIERVNSEDQTKFLAICWDKLAVMFPGKVQIYKTDIHRAINARNYKAA